LAFSLVLVNPRASKGRDAATLAALTERAGLVLTARDGTAPRVLETADPREVEPRVREALDEGATAVIGVGGDGTLQAIAAVLAGTDVPLGIVPAGTGNQVAHALGVPRSPASAVDALEGAAARSIDLGEVTFRSGTDARTSSFIIGCGAGFDAELMATTSVTLKRRLGTAAYFVQGARLALRASATPCRVTIDDRVIETPATTALIGNMGDLVPGRLGLREPLDPTDGALDLVLVDAGGLLRGVRNTLRTLVRTDLGGEAGDGSIRLRGEHISVEPLAPLPVEIDGDYVGEGSLHARVLPRALQVLLPSA
jgi:diacylglycerol kinase family enzyme